MPGVVLIVLIPDICLLPYFLYSHEYRLTKNNVYCAILTDQIVVGCPLGVPISYYIISRILTVLLYCLPSSTASSKPSAMTTDSTAMSLNPVSLNLFPIVTKNIKSSEMHPPPQCLYAFFFSSSFHYILNHTSNAKSNRTFNITYIVSSIVTQFNQKLKRELIKMKVELHHSIISF